MDVLFLESQYFQGVITDGTVITGYILRWGAVKQPIYLHVFIKV